MFHSRQRPASLPTLLTVGAAAAPWLAQAWNATTLQCQATLTGHEDNVRVLAVGQGYLFSGSWDKSGEAGCS